MNQANTSQRNTKLGFAKYQNGFFKVNLKSEVWDHFKQNKQGLCRCNYCGILFKPLNQSTTAMMIHLNRMHAQEVFGVSRSKKEQQQIINDFLQNMVVQGYPIDKIVDGLTKLFINYKQSFHQLMKKFIGDMPEIRYNMQQMLQALPLETDKSIVQQLIAQFFPTISQGCRKSLMQQYYWIYSNEEQIILNFKQHGYNIKTLYNDDNMNLMMLITDSMRTMYYKYGDCLSIDVVDKVFKKKSPYGFAQYSTWFFTGQNQNLQIVLFGFAITNQQNDKNIEFLFGNFFKQMNYIYPFSICIPPYIVFHQQIKKAAPSITIIVNWYHKLKFIKQILQNQIQQQSIMKSICDCFITPSQAQFDYSINKIMSKVSDQIAINYGVKHSNQNFCIHKIPLQFIGFSIQVKRYKDLEKHVRQVFIYQGNLARLFIYVIKLDKKLNFNGKEQVNIFQPSCRQDSQFPISQVQSSSYYLNSKVLKSSQIGKYRLSEQAKQRINIAMSQFITFKMQIVDPIKVCFMTRKTHISRWKIFTIIFRVQYDYWQCNCRFLKHTGIPCAHLIKVLQKFGGDYRVYVNPRWFVSQ